MKFWNLNVDLNALSLDPLASKWPAHDGIKDGYPPKKLLFYCYWLHETSYTYALWRVQTHAIDTSLHNHRV